MNDQPDSNFGIPFIPAQFDDMGLSWGAHRVYNHLVRRANGKGEAFPGIRKIKKVCGGRYEDIVSVIRELEMRGMIAVDRKAGARNKYRINSPSEWKPIALEPDQTVPTGGTVKPDQTVPTGGTHRSDRWNSTVPTGGTKGITLKVLQEGGGEQSLSSKTPPPPPVRCASEEEEKSRCAPKTSLRSKSETQQNLRNLSPSEQGNGQRPEGLPSQGKGNGYQLPSAANVAHATKPNASHANNVKHTTPLVEVPFEDPPKDPVVLMTWEILDQMRKQRNPRYKGVDFRWEADEFSKYCKKKEKRRPLNALCRGWTGRMRSKQEPKQESVTRFGQSITNTQIHECIQTRYDGAPF